MKTRLALSLGEKKAAELAGAMLQDVWHTVCRCEGLRAVLATVEPGLFPIEVSAQDIWLQQGDDLGQRIASILERGLRSAPGALALGADSPLLTTDHLARAMAGLASHDCALGPCLDGGFYLLGLRRCPPGLLDGLPWSSSQTAAATRRRIKERGLTISELPVLGDVDTADDLGVLAQALARDPAIAPATRRVLQHAD